MSKNYIVITHEDATPSQTQILSDIYDNYEQAAFVAKKELEVNDSLDFCQIAEITLLGNLIRGEDA
jgi:hypothetical protein